MSHFNPVITGIIQDLGPGFMRQHLFHGNTAYLEMVDAMAPTTKFLGAAGQLSDVESDVRAEIAAWRTDARSANLLAISGPNEPNGSGSGGFTGSQPSNTVRQMYWICDEVANGGTWTHRAGNAPPLIIGPALKRAGFSSGHQYDDDIASMAAATYNPGGGAVSLDDLPGVFSSLTFRLDFHRYIGTSSPGSRTNGQDTYGNVPPSVVLGVDSKVSLVDLEIALAQQMAPSIPVGYWTEGGWTDGDGTPSLPTRAKYGVESYLRAYLRGVKHAQYETVDEYPLYGSREDYFGLYRPISNPNGAAGPKPIYTALQGLFGYTGAAPFFDATLSLPVGWIEPISGNDPDCGVVVFSKALGGWDINLLTEGRNSCDFVTATGHSVTGLTPTTVDSFGNSHYTIDLTAATMTTLAVV